MSRGNVTIIFNNEGYDRYEFEGREISIDNDLRDTVADVKAALEEKGFIVSLTPFESRKRGALDDFMKGLKKSPDGFLFNLCEGAFSSSSFEMHVAALLELYGFKFTGSGALTLGLALNKGLTKDILKSRGIPTPEHFVTDGISYELKKGRRFPLIVKPLKEDASVGIDAGAVVNTEEDLKKRVEFVVGTYKQNAIVEEYIEGRELNIAVLGNGKEARTLPPSEIEFVDFPEDQPRICCYEAKWVVESPLYHKTVPVCPASIPEALGTDLSDTALKAYRIMGCRDYARVDVRVAANGGVKVLEVNPNPDISRNAGLARAARAAGMDYGGLISGIVDLAMARYSGAQR
ncbi:MAG: ATP-grasp domain-containing protein [Deltaproteobacteria bacterium]|nr:ATP-grasp domain-containing protein [Deltaproteobacteria bacterium]